MMQVPARFGSLPEHTLQTLADVPSDTTALRLALGDATNVDGVLRRFEKLETLFLDGYLLADVRGVYGLPIVHLAVRNLSACIDFPAFETLHTLYLQGTFDSVPRLKTASPMKELELQMCQFGSFAGFASYTALETLRLGWCALPNLEGIEALTKLRVLVLNHTPVGDVTAVDGHPSLRVIATHDSALPKAEFPKSMRWCVDATAKALQATNLAELAERKPPSRSSGKGTGKKRKAQVEANLARLLQSKDRKTVDQGVELLRALDEGWDDWLDGLRYDPQAHQSVRAPRKGPFGAHVTLSILALAPKRSKIANAFRSQVRVLHYQPAGKQVLTVCAWTFSAFPRLRRIELDRVHLDASGPAPELPSLELVDLHRVPTLENLDWLKGAPRVKRLRVVGTSKLRNRSRPLTLGAIRGMQLEQLELREVPILDPDCIRGLEDLKKLTLGFACFDVDPARHLGDLPKLVELDVHRSISVTNLEWLDTTPNLRSMKLDMREIRDFEPLYRHPKLDTVIGTGGYGEVDEKRLREKGITLRPR